MKTNTIFNLLKNCSVRKASGIDNLFGKFLKDGADVTAIPIMQICNISIKLSHFLKDCKVAKLLPIVSKTIEKINDQSMDYLTENKILYRYQSRFCKNYSTDTSLSYLTYKILTGFDSGLLTGMIDFQNAFDTIKHEILLKENVLSWIFKSVNKLV